MLLTGALALVGCQSAGPDQPVKAQAPAETLASATPAPAGPPPLQSVPPRPQLSYTVQQQRQIVEALVADRENARYTGQVVRYRSGLSSLPPPPAPPATVAMPDLSAARTRAPAPSEPPLAEKETLVDFLAALRRQFFADEPEPAAVPAVEPAAGPLPASPDPGADAAPEQEADPTALPPAQNAVAARMASRPHVIDEILDESLAQAPAPALQTADDARQEAPQQAVADEAPSAPLPAPRPAAARLAGVVPVPPGARPLVVAPPPLKPLVPVDAPAPPPLDGDRSAGLAPALPPEAGALAGARGFATPTTPRS